ncbi:MAG: hypothetical protein F4066_09685 [Chloroflexi bacterium]|nr:hypothetical protein [Chloroflexota bacterium]MYF80504.1 hypothetical protein [Chloroflexota bacterium]MYI05112.1 hypothetical protein [Chloroflexota bacterium]
MTQRTVAIGLAVVALLVGVIAGGVLGTGVASAHPPSEENESTDTVPHPKAGENVLPENVINWVAKLTGDRAEGVCVRLALAGLVWSSINPPPGITTFAIGVGCWAAGDRTKFSAKELMAAVKFPQTMHSRGGGAYNVSASCVAALGATSEAGEPSPAIIKQCGIDRHIGQHHNFEQGPAKHAAERAAGLAKAKKDLAEHVAVYQDYIGPRLIRGQYHANADVLAAQRLALELAYPNNRQPLEITLDYQEPHYTWDSDAQAWRKTETTNTLSHTLIVTGPGCPVTYVNRMVEEYYLEPVERTRQVPYTVEVEKTRRLPYTVEETRTRRVPYSVGMPRTRQVPYDVQVTKYRDETYTVQVQKTRREAYQVPVTRYRTRTVTVTEYRQEGYRVWVDVPVQVTKTRYRTETRYRWVHDGLGGRLESYTVRVPYTVTVTEYRRTPVDRVRTVPVQVQRTITEPYLTTETRYRNVTYTVAEQRTRRVPYTVTETRYRTEHYIHRVTKYRTEEYTVEVTKYREETYTETETRYREETYTENVRRSRMVERRMPQEQCPPHIADARALYDRRASEQD